MALVHTSEVNDAEKRLLVINAEPRFSFLEKKEHELCITLITMKAIESHIWNKVQMKVSAIELKVNH